MNTSTLVMHRGVVLRMRQDTSNKGRHSDFVGTHRACLWRRGAWSGTAVPRWSVCLFLLLMGVPEGVAFARSVTDSTYVWAIDSNVDGVAGSGLGNDQKVTVGQASAETDTVGAIYKDSGSLNFTGNGGASTARFGTLNVLAHKIVVGDYKYGYGMTDFTNVINGTATGVFSTVLTFNNLSGNGQTGGKVNFKELINGYFDTTAGGELGGEFASSGLVYNIYDTDAGQVRSTPTTSAYVTVVDFSSNVGHSARFDQEVVFKNYAFTYGSPFVLEVQVFAQSKVANLNTKSADFSGGTGERMLWQESSIVDLSAVLSGMDVFNLDGAPAQGYSLTASVDGSDPFALPEPEPCTLGLLSAGTLCLLKRRLGMSRRSGVGGVEGSSSSIMSAR